MLRTGAHSARRARPAPVRGIAVALLCLLLAGCAGAGASRSGAPATGAPAVRGLPASIDRNELLTRIAACHLRRVAQNADRGATDAVVVAAVEGFGFDVAEMIERSNALMRAAAEDASARERLRGLSDEACEQLAALTGVPPSLVRFDESGMLDNTWVSVRGEIGEGFADEVIERLRREKAVGLLINSPGGSLYEARKLGRYLRANGLRAGVNGLCTSACVDVLAGGIERYVTANAKLGIHQSKVPQHLSSHEGGQLSVVASVLYLREMGIDDGIALAAATVPNNQMYWIPVPEALQTGLATKLVDRL
ncbi:MAG: hypothetical protein PVH47_05870 [Thiohalocapsa sp.]|jgi:hypothetical protein